MVTLYAVLNDQYMRAKIAFFRRSKEEEDLNLPSLKGSSSSPNTFLSSEPESKPTGVMAVAPPRVLLGGRPNSHDFQLLELTSEPWNLSSPSSSSRNDGFE